MHENLEEEISGSANMSANSESEQERLISQEQEQETPLQVLAVSRRRRKRSRPKSTTSTGQPSTKAAVPGLDDSTLAFLDDNGDFLEDRNRPVLSSVPILLAQRQLGGTRSSTFNGRRQRRYWQHLMLKHHVNRPPLGQPRRQWRSFAARSIPFTQLGTPHSDAVLALDRQGSFVLCLGTKDVRNAPLALALRFFGIPSPAAIATQQRGVAMRGALVSPTPLLQTTPLLFDILDESQHEEDIFNFRPGISPATTPVKILMSNDWKMGVALFQPSNVWTEEGTIGTLVLFSSPTSSGRGVGDSIMKSTIFQCANVSLGADASFSHRNLLWRVETLPVDGISESATTRTSHPSTSVQFLNLPGYLFFNDENDGFRLTWSMEDWNLDDSCSSFDSRRIQESPMAGGGVVPAAAIFSSETTWERLDADALSGEKIIPVTGKPAGVRIVHESFLHIDVLLRDILSRRKGMAGEGQPTEYVYNLIAVTNAGRIAEFIITFIRTQKPGSLGVFVKVDLYLGRYQELSWMKNTSSRDPGALRSWCNALALNQRMKDLRIGPYAAVASRRNHAMDWSKLAVEKSFDPDEDDDFCPSFWEEYVDSGEAIATRKPPKLVSLSAIYPDCDLITNKAITDCIPVSSLRGKNSPTQLAYG